MTGSRQQLEPRGRDRLRVGAAVVRVGDPIAFSPQHQGRHADGAEALAQRRIDHGWRSAVDGQRGSVAGHGRLLRRRHLGHVDPERIRVVVAELGDLVHREAEEVRDRVARHLDADGVDEDDAADPRRPQQGHLGADPAAD